LQAEVAKLTGPETDPIKIALAKERQERLADKAVWEKERAEAKRDKLLVKAIEIASKEGVPTAHIKRFLEDDEDATVASVNAFVKDWKESVSAGVEKGLKEKFGNTGTPKGGTPAGKGITLKEFSALPPKEQAAKMKDGFTIIEE
jgi:DNA-binding transcriptional MerR regulator